MLNVKPEFPVEPKVLAVLEHIRTAAAALKAQLGGLIDRVPNRIRYVPHTALIIKLRNIR